MKKVFILCLNLYSVGFLFGQVTVQWTETDRAYLLKNLTETRDALIAETKDLKKSQWDFKESPDRWSIRQITEHVAFWELIMQRDISRSLALGPNPEQAAKVRDDKTIEGYILEETPHVSNDYTQPFTFSQPLGLNRGQDNVTWFLKMRNEEIEYIGKTSDNLRLYIFPTNGNNTHQLFITTWGHTFRHLRQIKKVKQHPNFPK